MLFLYIVLCVVGVESFKEAGTICNASSANVGDESTTEKEYPGMPYNNKTGSSSKRVPGAISKEQCLNYIDHLYQLHVIVGGTQTEFLEFPHMALLGYKTEENEEIQWSCGGSLISENFVLTAAHCVTGKTDPPKFVRIGITEQSNLSHLQERTVNETIIYPEYTGRAKYHDIALLRLDKDIQLSKIIYPACLYTEKNITAEEAIATGWGVTEYLGSGSNHLLKVNLNFILNENCTAKYRRQIKKRRGPLQRGIDDELMICAGSMEEVKNTCQGDSGGPLQIYHSGPTWNSSPVIKPDVLDDDYDDYDDDDDDGGSDTHDKVTNETKPIQTAYDIVGVTSFGRVCSLEPGIYTRVSHYIQWIEDIVWPE